MFRKLCGVGLLIVAVGPSWTAWAIPDQDAHNMEWYASAEQDVIEFNGGTDEDHLLYLNDEPIKIKELAEQLKQADAICLLGSSSGDKKDSLDKLIDVLMQIESTGIPDELINLRLECIRLTKPGNCDVIKIASDGALLFDGKSVMLSELPNRLSADREVGIESDPRQPPPPFSRIMAVVKAVGKQRIRYLFIADRNRQVKISASIVQVAEDGEEHTLSSPSITSQPGCGGMTRAVQNNSGYSSFFHRADPFHQQDLGNLGIRFSVRPFLMGDYIRVRGVMILVKQADPRQEMFKQGDVPIYSYSVSKFVCPFSCVVPPNDELVELPLATVGGLKTVCRLSASLTDARGEPLGPQGSKPR